MNHGTAARAASQDAISQGGPPFGTGSLGKGERAYYDTRVPRADKDLQFENHTGQPTRILCRR